MDSGKKGRAKRPEFREERSGERDPDSLEDNQSRRRRFDRPGQKLAPDRERMRSPWAPAEAGPSFSTRLSATALRRPRLRPPCPPQEGQLRTGERYPTPSTYV